MLKTLLVAAVIRMGSGFGGGRLRTASPTILMRREAADEVWMGGGEGLGLGRGAPRPYRGMGEQAGRLRYGKPEACATRRKVATD
jgi:hypothetical protein